MFTNRQTSKPLTTKCACWTVLIKKVVTDILSSICRNLTRWAFKTHLSTLKKIYLSLSLWLFYILVEYSGVAGADGEH